MVAFAEARLAAQLPPSPSAHYDCGFGGTCVGGTAFAWRSVDEPTVAGFFSERARASEPTERSGDREAPRATRRGVRGAKPPDQVLKRKGGFEPPRSCERQPLKLTRAKADRGGRRKIAVQFQAQRPNAPAQGRVQRNPLHTVAHGRLIAPAPASPSYARAGRSDRVTPAAAR